MSLAYVHPLFSVILHYSRAEVPYTDLLFAPVESSPGSEIASYLDSWVQFFLLRECNFGFTKCFCCLFFVVLWLVGLFVVVMRFFLFAWDVSLWFCLVGFVFFTFFGQLTCLRSKICHQFHVPLHVSMVWPPVTPLECLAIGSNWWYWVQRV